MQPKSVLLAKQIIPMFHIVISHANTFHEQKALPTKCIYANYLMLNITPDSSGWLH